MKRAIAFAALAFAIAAPANAQNALAPWFDSDGFYNKPGIDLARATNDLTACRAEAARLKVVRNTNTPVGNAMAFRADGTYDPVVSGLASGIASIMFAIQDARYNGSIEQIEFRDCAVALGFRHYRLGERDRARFDAQADRGFAVLVASAAPSEGRLNEDEIERNYFDAALAETGYQNAPPPAPITSALAPESEAIESEPGPVEQADPEPEALPAAAPAPNAIARLGADEIAAPQPGMAVVVVSARQLSGSTRIPAPGDTFRFKRVTADGRFLDLVQPTTSFGVRSHFNPDRRRDPTLRGDFEAPRYSTFVVPTGRYVLSDVGPVNACLGTLAFDASDGDVLYLGDFVLRPQGLPMGSLFNPVGNINSGMDNRLRADLRVGIGDAFDAAREALQADAETKARLRRVTYLNGYRIPCDGRYIGRVANPAWPSLEPAQVEAFHDDLAASVAAAQQN